jgi:hypothetical protein
LIKYKKQKKLIDLIGDVHGHADKLEELLLKLGYSKNKGAFSHLDRKVLFVGDYIDRGPKIRETLEIVRQWLTECTAKIKEIGLMGTDNKGNVRESVYYKTYIVV